MTNDDRGLENALISVWRQVKVEEAKTVIVEGRDFSVRRTSRYKLREVDFRFDGHELRGLEQNPATSSRSARSAREGKKVMQFLADAATLPLWWTERCGSM